MSDVIYKIIFVGLGQVGKTSICSRIEGKDWYPDYRATLGMNLFNHELDIDDKHIQTIIYDTGGQALFQSLNKFYYRGATGAVVVYDITMQDSFDTLKSWVDTIKEECGVIPLLILGNKTDLEEKVIDDTQTKEFIEELKQDWVLKNVDKTIFNSSDIPILFHEGSAKTEPKDLQKIFDHFINLINRLTS